jgi:Pectate lyase superfamily protein
MASSGVVEAATNPTFIENLNDTLQKFQLGSTQLFNGFTYQYVKHNKGTGAVVTHTGDQAYWLDETNFIVTADVGSSQDAAGTYGGTILDGRYTWIKLSVVTSPIGFSGGVSGDQLTRDTTQKSGAIFVGPTWVNVKTFRAKGDGVTDDTVAIQNAQNSVSGGTIAFPAPGNYRANVQMKSYMQYRGGGIGGTTIQALNSGRNIFEGPLTGQLTHASIKDMTLSGGLNSIYMGVPAGGNPSTFIKLEDLDLGSFSGAGILWDNQIEEWWADNLVIFGGQYGLRANFPSVGTMDKCNFSNVECGGQSINGIRLECFLSTTVTFNNLIVLHATQHGIYVDGSFSSLVFINLNTEYNGYQQASVVTTGNINSGSATLTVASATGLTIGDTVTVKGAGANNADLITTIDNIVGTTVTLHVTAGTTVPAGTEVTNSLWSDVFVNNTIATPRYIQFIGGVIGVRHDTLSSLRYTMDASRASITDFINTATSRPIYDPGSNVATWGRGSINEVRQGNALNTNDSFNSSGPGYKIGPRTLMASPQGGNIDLALIDSNGNGSGTFGEVRVRVSDANKTNVVRMGVGASYDMIVYGSVQPFVGVVARSGGSDPTTTDIPSGKFMVWKNTGSGVVKLWYNDGGVMKSVALA